MQFSIAAILLAVAGSALADSCTPGTYSCLGTQEIGVCDANGEWIVSSLCGRGGSCDDGSAACRNDASGVPHCYC